MKKLLLKLIAALSVPVILWYLYVLIFPVYYMDDEYPHNKQQKDYVNLSSDHNDILIIGDSAAKAAMTAHSIDGMSVYNIALSSATSVETCISLRNYLENHDAPEAVIALFSFRSLTSNEWLETRMFYFHYYSLPELYELYKNGRELDDPYWNADGIESDILRYYLRDPKLYLAAIYNSNLFGRYEKNTQIYKQAEHDRGWLVFGTSEDNYDTADIEKAEHFDVMPMQDYYLRQIIELCKENDIRIIIEQPPIKESAISGTRENVISEFEEYFTKLQEEYPDALIDTSPIFYSNTYFCDYGHLNPKGAEKFTEEIYAKYFPSDR